eukprot:scaffold43435_cov27-Cyclotella_meneghiniana.AAC.1
MESFAVACGKADVAQRSKHKKACRQKARGQKQQSYEVKLFEFEQPPKRERNAPLAIEGNMNISDSSIWVGCYSSTHQVRPPSQLSSIPQLVIVLRR